MVGRGVLSDGEVEGEAAYRIQSLTFAMWIETQE